MYGPTCPILRRKQKTCLLVILMVVTFSSNSQIPCNPVHIINVIPWGCSLKLIISGILYRPSHYLHILEDTDWVLNTKDKKNILCKIEVIEKIQGMYFEMHCKNRG